MGQARNMTDAKARVMTNCSAEAAGSNAGRAEAKRPGLRTDAPESPEGNMLEMLDRNSADARRAGDLAHKREHYRALDFGVATGESCASDLKLAVNRLIADCQRFDGPEIELCHDLSGGELGPVFQTPVLCIVRELLTNACRHSKSRRILVGIGQDDTQVYIQVQDWGVGFNCTALSPKPRGLKDVRELVQSLGGIMDIDSRLGNGTCIAIEIPVAKERRQAGGIAREKD